MAMAKGVVGGCGWVGRTDSKLGSSSRPTVCHRICCPVKGLGSAGLPVVGLPLKQQSGGGGRGGGVRRRTYRGERAPRCGAQVLPEQVAESTGLTQYEDSWLDVAAIEFLTNRITLVSGKTTDAKGYDGFVDMTRKLVYGLPVEKQGDIVRKLLHVVVPGWLLFCMRIFPNTTVMKECYARFASVFFKWLVGDCEVRKGEVNGVLINSTVHIKKCRYLEHSQCVGLCVNLCKNPTQEFIGKQFGMPLRMNPNFEDMSCDMIFGLDPVPLEEDPAYQQSCYALCKTAKTKPTCT